MDPIYLFIVAFLLILAVFDLFIGVSNDAVNFLNSAIGSKVSTYRTILICASIGIIFGAFMSSGMMDLARHGIMNPSNFTFNEVMIVFLAVMVADVLVLDMFNNLGLPTSTTVSLVFDLLGATFVLAAIKMTNNADLQFIDLLNTEKAITVIIAIFTSVALAFVVGAVAQWLARIVFTFNYKGRAKIATSLFGGVAIVTLLYFTFMKGFSNSAFISSEVKDIISNNTSAILIAIFIVGSIVSGIALMFKANIFKYIILSGTFALAMAFAGNDLVNFIGVPLAGLSSFEEYSKMSGNDSFLMTSLLEPAKTNHVYLLIAAGIMIFAMSTSKKAKKVIKTSVDLSKSDEGDDMFGSSKAARSIVRVSFTTNTIIKKILPNSIIHKINSRFAPNNDAKSNEVAFDEVRASLNTVIAAILIIAGTNLKLPLSTTYVTFMVAMGTSLADRAWGRENAVFRITGVLSVIGGWFLTAGIAFITAGLVCAAMFYGGSIVMILLMIITVGLLFFSNKNFNKKEKVNHEDEMFKLMLRSDSPSIVWELLCRHMNRTQSDAANFMATQYQLICDGVMSNNVSVLKNSNAAIKQKIIMLKKYRSKELIAIRKAPNDMAFERNTWFHLAIDSSKQYTYSLQRIIEPVLEHVDNNFTPLTDNYKNEYKEFAQKVNKVLLDAAACIKSNRFDRYKEIRNNIEDLRSEIRLLRKEQVNRAQQENNNVQVSLLYLNIIQETEQILNTAKMQIKAVRKFVKD